MSFQLTLVRIALVITVVSATVALSQVRSTVSAADAIPHEPAAGRRIAPSAFPDKAHWHRRHGTHPGGNVRVHVGPVPPYGNGSYNVPQYEDYRSRAGYHVVDRLPTSPSRSSTVTVPDAEAFRGWAVSAFRDRQYREAMRLVKHAVIEDERNGDLYLKLSRTQIAVGQYESAADSLAHGLTLLNRAEWERAAREHRHIYANGEYERHLEALTVFIDESPDAAVARFLRGYHILFLGHAKTAREDLVKAAESPRYANPIRVLLGMAERATADGANLEELPPPMAPATERSR